MTPNQPKEIEMQNFEFCIKRTKESPKEIISLLCVDEKTAKKYVAEDYAVWVYRPSHLQDCQKPWLD